MKNADRRFDIVLFGATGYTGRLTAEYLAREGGKDLRWALAGRNRGKLETVREGLATIEPGCATLPLLAADVGDAAGLRALAESARVVITTVGPYILHGEPLVAACAAAGTDYVDLTGEPEFVDRMWLRHHQTARDNGARIVHSCGFDSIPHDLGAYFTVQQLPDDVPLTVRGYVSASGTFSTGTYHSAIHAFSRVRETAKIKQSRVARERDEAATRRVGSAGGAVQHHKALGSWVVPFPSIDPQIVKRSARAIDRYGPAFRYSHFIEVKKLQTVAALLGGAGALFVAAQFKPSRQWLLDKRQSGEGPTPEQRAKGWFRVRFLAEAEDAARSRVVVDVRGGDPGYGDTSKMLAESALCLAFDELPDVAGQLTTAQAMGDALIPRLQRAGIVFELVSDSSQKEVAA